MLLTGAQQGKESVRVGFGSPKAVEQRRLLFLIPSEQIETSYHGLLVLLKLIFHGTPPDPCDGSRRVKFCAKANPRLGGLQELPTTLWSVSCKSLRVRSRSEVTTAPGRSDSCTQHRPRGQEEEVEEAAAGEEKGRS